uniref:Uncharacterized protein n=1 Tax=Arundo donax TaxID=35708 RepID=A0A0A9EQR7_ARUDO
MGDDHVFPFSLFCSVICISPSSIVQNEESVFTGCDRSWLRYGGLPWMPASTWPAWMVQRKSLVGTPLGSSMYMFTSSNVWSHSNTFCPLWTKACRFSGASFSAMAVGSWERVLWLLEPSGLS